MKLPALPERVLLADLCREAAATHGVEPAMVEKDFYLTRTLWALAQRLDDRVLLKGGTLLSKVDLGFLRMSEDADLVIAGTPSRSRGVNARKTNAVRDALKAAAPLVGVRVKFPGGDSHDRSAHVVWDLEYESAFGPQRILVEASVRPVLEPPRRAKLQQLLVDGLAGDSTAAWCWALSAGEARAEKVRAAFTRDAIRDFYDLDRLLAMGADFTSRPFIKLVDAKLAELDRLPLAQQPAAFGVDAIRRRALETSLALELPAVLRAGAPPFSLDAMLARFDALWGMR